MNEKGRERKTEVASNKNEQKRSEIVENLG